VLAIDLTVATQLRGYVHSPRTPATDHLRPCHLVRNGHRRGSAAMGRQTCLAGQITSRGMLRGLISASVVERLQSARQGVSSPKTCSPSES
jgi:hypothetical protein